MASSEVISTFCRICECRCGIDVTVSQDRAVHIGPDKLNPFTWRDFCVKGRTAAELVEHPVRLRHPMRRVGSAYVPSTWDEAINTIADSMRQLIDESGPDAIAFYSGNPTGFSGSNVMFLSGLASGIGTANQYYVSSVDENNTHVVSEQMFGRATLPLIPDVDPAKYFLLVGMNPAESTLNWSGNVPNGWKRILAAQANGADLIVVDPRRTPSAERADLHVPVWPGTDWAFLLAVLTIIMGRGWDRAPSAFAVDGLDQLRAFTRRLDLRSLAERCRIDLAVIVNVARLFAAAPTGMCLTHTGVAHSETGTVGEWLGQLLNLVTDRLDRPGGRRFEPGYVDAATVFGDKTSQARASGGNRSRVRGVPTITGFRSLAELPDEITTPGTGRIRALFINSGNPTVSGPDGESLRRAMSELDLLVAVDLMQRDSHRNADWLLPSAHWLERDDLLLHASSLEDQPFVQFGRAALTPPADVREEWELWLDLALALDVPFFGRRFTEEQRAARREARRTRRAELGLNPRAIQRSIIRKGGRLTWDEISEHPHGLIYGQRSYGHLADQLDGVAGIVQATPALLMQELERLLAVPAAAVDPAFPFTFINRRRVASMNSWLNEMPSLARRRATNELEMNSEDAAALGLAESDLVTVTSAVGSVDLPLTLSDAVRRGVVVAEHGWGSALLDPTGNDRGTSLGVNRNELVSNRQVDPLSQIPAFNTTAVRVHEQGVPPVDPAFQ